jgi:exportin-5
MSHLASPQVLGYILAPLASQWSDPSWRQSIGTPLSFAATFLPLEQMQEAQTHGTTFSLGARAKRWSLYHQATLLERAYRRTLTGPNIQQQDRQHQQSSSGCGTDASPCSSHALSIHLSWSLPVVAQLLRCLHGLWEPSVLQVEGLKS